MEVRFIRHGKEKALKIYICIGVRGQSKLRCYSMNKGKEQNTFSMQYQATCQSRQIVPKREVRDKQVTLDLIGIEALRTQVHLDLMNIASGISMMPNLAAKSPIMLVLRGVCSARAANFSP